MPDQLYAGPGHGLDQPNRRGHQVQEGRTAVDRQRKNVAGRCSVLVNIGLADDGRNRTTLRPAQLDVADGRGPRPRIEESCSVQSPTNVPRPSRGPPGSRWSRPRIRSDASAKSRTATAPKDMKHAEDLPAGAWCSCTSAGVAPPDQTFCAAASLAWGAGNAQCPSSVGSAPPRSVVQRDRRARRASPASPCPARAHVVPVVTAGGRAARCPIRPPASREVRPPLNGTRSDRWKKFAGRQVPAAARSSRAIRGSPALALPCATQCRRHRPRQPTERCSDFSQRAPIQPRPREHFAAPHRRPGAAPDPPSPARCPSHARSGVPVNAPEVGSPWPREGREAPSRPGKVARPRPVVQTQDRRRRLGMLAGSRRAAGKLGRTVSSTVTESPARRASRAWCVIFTPTESPGW